jgi:hypothetical protein
MNAANNIDKYCRGRRSAPSSQECCEGRRKKAGDLPHPLMNAAKVGYIEAGDLSLPLMNAAKVSRGRQATCPFLL